MGSQLLQGVQNGVQNFVLVAPSDGSKPEEMTLVRLGQPIVLKSLDKTGCESLAAQFERGRGSMTYRIDQLASRTGFSRALAGIARVSSFPPSRVARAITSSGLWGGLFKVGDRVEAEWTPPQPSRWASATVVGINADGTSDVTFDDCPAEKWPRELRWIRAEPSIAELCEARCDLGPPLVHLPTHSSSGELNDSQRHAVEMATSNRLTLVQVPVLQFLPPLPISCVV